jgi:hypothetical protein
METVSKKLGDSKIEKLGKATKREDTELQRNLIPVPTPP